LGSMTCYRQRVDTNQLGHLKTFSGEIW